MTRKKTDKTLPKNILQHAAVKCAESGSRLTQKRSQILTILLESQEPLSAYDVLNHYNAKAEKPMPAMSVYRILDYLVSEQLAHKLSSENKYIGCSHIVCCDEHKVPQFLICRNCNKVKEIVIPKDIIKSLRKCLNEVNYQLKNSQLELDCLCEDCRKI